MALGIDKIKAAMKLLADLRNATAEALADGTFQWQEAFGFIPSLMQIQGVIQSKDELIAEIKDASHAEREELETYGIDILKIPSAEVEEFIVKATDWVILTVQMITKGTDLRSVASKK